MMSTTDLSMITLLGLEVLEERIVPTIGPSTVWHYSPGANFSFGNYNALGDPGSIGFNLVDVTSPSQLNQIPTGDKALIFINTTDGVDQNFLNKITPYLHNPQVFGFYLADEPDPNLVPAANLKAESDWIHQNDPGAKTFLVMNGGYIGYTPQNTDIDYVGLDPYPFRVWGPNLEYIPYAIWRTELLGWNNSQIVPIYQGFAGGVFALPDVLDAEVELAVWSLFVPNPPFDYTFAWNEPDLTTLVDRSDLQGVFWVHNTTPQTTLFDLWVSTHFIKEEE